MLISLFVYFSPHLPRHAVPQCFPSSLVRSYCCALMHVLGWCSCPGYLCLFVCVRVCSSASAYVRGHAGIFSFPPPLWLNSCREAIPPVVSENSSCFWPFCRTCAHARTSHARMFTHAGDGWCYYLKLLRGREVLKRTNTSDYCALS